MDHQTLLLALADPIRLRLMGLLVAAPHEPNELADMLGMPVSDVWRQLGVLAKAGLVSSSPDRVFSADLSRLDSVRSELAPPEAEPDESIPFGLRQFFRAGQLVSMPAKRSRQIEILQILIEDFSGDRDYIEREVNQIILKRYPDFATIRRDFIDEGFMARDQGIYRRLPRPDENHN